MTTPIIVPEEAERAGCTAVAQPNGQSGASTFFYLLVAAAAPGWRFVDWQWSEHWRYHRTTATGPIPDDYDDQHESTVREQDVTEYAGLFSGSTRGYTLDKTIDGVIATFVKVSDGNGLPLFDPATGLLLHGTDGSVLFDS